MKKLHHFVVASAPAAAALVGFVIVWELLVVLFSVSPLILPSPRAIASVLFAQLGYLLTHSAITLLEAVLGFLLGGGLAFALAVLFEFYPRARQAIFPYAILVKAIPLIALAPLIVLWFGSGLLSKIVLAGIIAFFPMLVNSIQGLRSVAPEALDLMATFTASKREVLTKLKIPSALPAVFAGMKISSTFAVVGAVVAEFVGAQQGIGYVIKSSSYYLDTDLTFAAIIVTAFSALLFFGTIVLLERRVLFWQSGRGEHLLK